MHRQGASILSAKSAANRQFNPFNIFAALEGGPFSFTNNWLATPPTPPFFQGPGIAPTGDPGQGFDIEGNLQANTPNANTTDWVPGVAGAGVGVLSAAGVPVDATKTFHSIDVFDSQADNIFTGGSKVNDNPNTNWSWTTGKPTAKDDINHGLLHIATDANNHLWFVVGGDRLSNNGDSHINFEFLQNTVVRNANGTFTSAGPNGGRTEGDLLLNIDLNMGGIVPDFEVSRWQQVSPGVYDYVPITPATGAAFIAANNAGSTPVSFGAFGAATYSQNQFGEGALDITALITNLNPCIGIKTVFIKTAASQSPSATLKDFIDPIQVNLGTVPVAAVNSATICEGGTATLTATVTNGAMPYTFSWTGPNGFTANAQTINVSTAGVYTVTVTSVQGCVSEPASGTVTVNLGATVNAGADQTVCATSPTVQLNGSIGGGATSAMWSGTGTFTPDANTLNATYMPSAAEIAAGTVTLTLTTNDPNGPCTAASDTVTITINPAATVNAGPDQTVCASSPTVTLASSIGGAATNATWSGGTGIFSPDANTLNATYTPSAAEIAAGSVTLALTTDDPAGPCGAVSDTMVITINPAATVNAGPDQTVCSTSPTTQLNGTIGGSATSATWSGGAGAFNPNASTLNATYTPSAAEIAAGTVTLTLTTNDPAGPCGAVSDQIVMTINQAPTVNAGADQTVCSTSPTVQLNGTIGGGASSAAWSGGSGAFNPDANTLNATYTPSAAEIAAGTVTLTLTTNDPAGPCGAVSDTVTITVNQAATVNAGPDQTVCSSSPIVQLNGAIGGASSAMWSGGSGTFNSNANTLNATYTPSAAEIANGSVTLTLTTNDPAGPCGPVSDTMVITINPAATVNAGSDQTVCASSPTVQLAGAIGGGASGATWSGGAGAFNPNANTLNATYTPSAAEIAAGTVTLTLTTNDPAGPCGAVSDQMVITILPFAAVNAGEDIQTCASNPTVTLGGSVGGSATGGVWSGGTGAFNPNNTTLNAMYTPSAAEIANGSVTLTLTTTGPCASVSDTVTIFIGASASASAGPDQTVCSSSPAVQLAGSIGGAPGGMWSGGTGTFNPNNTTLNATYTPSALEIAAGTVTLTLTTVGGSCGTDSDSMTITINPAATVNAGADQTVCATNPNIQLAGVVGGGASSATWSGGAGTFNPNADTLNAVYTPSPAEIAAGTVTLTLTTNDPAGPCGAVSDTMIITINPAAIVNAGSDQTVCATSPTVQLAGSIGGAASGATWSGGAGTFNPNNTMLNATYTPSAAEITAGTVTLTLTTNDPAGPCGSVSDQMVIAISPAAVANAGPDQTVCATGPNVQLAGSVSGGATSGTWSGGAGTFNPNATTLNAVYTPSAAEIAAGTATLTLTTNDPVGPCGAATDTITITINPAATVNAGADQPVCATSPAVQLNGVIGGAASGAAWSGGTGTFNPNANTLNATYTPSAAEIAAGTVTLTLTTNDPAGPCGAVSDQMAITINPAATVNAGSDQTVCASSPTVQLAGAVGGGASTGMWSGGTGMFSPNANTLNATYTPSAAELMAGTVTLTLTTNDPAGPCGAVSDTMILAIDPAAAVNAGPDQTVCATSPNVQLNGTVGGGATTGTWSGGTGTFNPNASTLNATYTPSAAEIAAGTVTLTLTTNDPNGPCGPVSEAIVITINPAATVNAGADRTACATNPNVQLSGAVGGGASSGTWSTSGTGTFSPNATTLNATYIPSAADITAGTVTLTLTTNDPAGPCGPVSDTMVVTLNPAATVNAGTDINVPACATAVQLAGTIGGGATGATWTTSGTGTFSPNATTLNASYIPSAADLAAGQVTLTLTTNDPPGPCGPISDQAVLRFSACGADLSLTKTVDNGAPCGGANVTFTITVRNSGPGVANNVAVRDVLPAGLVFVSAQASQGSYNSGNGIWTIGTLNVGQVVTLTITATVTPVGDGATNTAEVISSSAPDPDSTPNNNNPNEDDQASVSLTTPKGPGRPFPAAAETSDQKAGSVLVYNLYTSNASSPNTQNTRISLTNTNPSASVAVHLYFVDGSNCSVADSFVCLTPNQTTSFQTADLDPGTTGYLVAVAVDCDTGCPVAPNCLIGDAYVKFSSGHAANLGAEAFSALRLNPAGCDTNSATAELKFDGVSYNRMPRVLAADNLPNRPDGNDTLLVINRIGGNLAIGANTLGSMFGLLYNDTETAFSFTFNSGACQFRSSLSGNFLRTAPRYESIIPAGRSGWMRLSASNDASGGILGAMINFNPDDTANSAAYNQGHNLHKLTLTTSTTLVIPVFAPACCTSGGVCIPR